MVWTQPGIGDTQGSFFETFNIDVSENEAKVRLGKRLIVNTSSDDAASMAGVPVGFRAFGAASHLYTAAGNGTNGYVYKTSINALDAAFAKDAVSNTPTNCDSAYCDIEILNGQLFVSTASQSVSYLSNDEATWTAFNAVGSDANKPHLFCVFGGRMYMTYGGNSIVSWDSSATPSVATAGAQYTLTLPGSTDSSNSQISWIRAASDKIWIGTINKQGGKGAVYSWDGSSTQTTVRYRLRSSGAVACVIQNDVPYIMDTQGRLLVWNGGTFVRVASLFTQNKRYLYNAYGQSNLRYIHPNGMDVINGKVSMLIDGRAYDGATGNPDTFTQIPNLPSGVYEFDTFPGADYNIFQNKGLIHKHSIALGHVATTISDYGQIRLKAVGALTELTFQQNSTPYNATFLVGASYTDDVSSAGGTKYGIWYDDINDTKQKAGYFVTPKIYSPNITEMWQKIFVQTKDLLNSGDKVVIKHRRVDVAATEVVGKATAVASVYAVTYAGDLSAAIAVGDEIMITEGVNSGICAHATSITYNGSSLTTIVVDETLTSSGAATIKFRYQKWTKGKSIAYGSVTPDEVPIGKVGGWIQFKMWMLFTGQDETEFLEIANKVNQALQ